ncbi:MAG: hypothetical protein IKI11_08695 [Neisseriaceae bacterium]|nr:hypothetical protein [Neisseriaceae bacterium]
MKNEVSGCLKTNRNFGFAKTCIQTTPYPTPNAKVIAAIHSCSINEIFLSSMAMILSA